MHDSVMALLKFQLDPIKKALPHQQVVHSLQLFQLRIIAAAANEEVKMIVTSEEKQNIVFAFINSESS